VDSSGLLSKGAGGGGGVGWGSGGVGWGVWGLEVGGGVGGRLQSQKQYTLTSYKNETKGERAQ